MAIQATLFDGEEVTRRYWEMGKESRASAVDIAIRLLRERTGLDGTGGPVSFHDIVKRRLGIDGDSIPEALAEVYADQFKMVRDSRHLIKDAIDEDGEFSLVIINAAGTSALRGGHPTGYALRASQAGEVDDRAQLEMTTGKLRRRVARERMSGVLADREGQIAMELVSTIEAILTPRDAPRPLLQLESRE